VKAVDAATRARRVLRAILCLAAMPALMGSQCEEPLVKDSGFDIWCGDALCDWQVDAGSVARVPTWHARDYGVALVGNPAGISQILPFSSEDVSCIHFDLLAKVDETANVVLALDFDGGVAQAETLPSGDWTPLSYHIVAPTYFHSVRITIRKVGDGQVALAQIQAAKSSDCSGVPPTGLLNRPAGATCEMAQQCAAGRCVARTLAGELLPDASAVRQVCASCIGDDDCATGTVCGLGWSPGFLEPFPACAPSARAELGDRCLVDAECAGDVCCGGVCSTCCVATGAPACGAREVCQARAQDPQGKPLRTAWQCTPGGANGTDGASCLADADCTGAACAGSGPLTVCAADGRRCVADGDCPGGAPGNSCIAIGVAGGICH
jgi:hypothetical protein